MATITPNTTYPNGAVLPVANHNANIYSTTSGRGIMSEPNGGLQVVNLDAAFTVRDEHIMPEEAVIARMDGSTIPMDVYNNAFGIRDDTDPVYVPIAGLGERVYVPYNVNTMIWQWSFHVSVFRPYMYSLDQQKQSAIADMNIKVFIDGVEVPVCQRGLPVSGDLFLDKPLDGTAQDKQLVETIADLFPDAPKTGAVYDYEHVCQLWFDLAVMRRIVSQGYHELTVKVYLPRVVFNPAGDTNPDELAITANTRDFSPNGTYDVADEIQARVHTRISFGTRNARCVMFK